MQYIVTKKEVQAIDGYAIEKMGMPAEVLDGEGSTADCRADRNVNR